MPFPASFRSRRSASVMTPASTTHRTPGASRPAVDASAPPTGRSRRTSSAGPPSRGSPARHTAGCSPAPIDCAPSFFGPFPPIPPHRESRGSLPNRHHRPPELEGELRETWTAPAPRPLHRSRGLPDAPILRRRPRAPLPFHVAHFCHIERIRVNPTPPAPNGQEHRLAAARRTGPGPRARREHQDQTDCTRLRRSGRPCPPAAEQAARSRSRTAPRPRPSSSRGPPRLSASSPPGSTAGHGVAGVRDGREGAPLVPVAVTARRRAVLRLQLARPSPCGRSPQRVAEPVGPSPGGSTRAAVQVPGLVNYYGSIPEIRKFLFVVCTAAFLPFGVFGCSGSRTEPSGEEHGPEGEGARRVNPARGTCFRRPPPRSAAGSS